MYTSRGRGSGGGGRVGGQPIEAPDRERARLRQGGRAAQAGDQRVRYDGGLQGKGLLPFESISISFLDMCYTYYRLSEENCNAL